MKRTALVLWRISSLIFLVVAGACFVPSGKANPLQESDQWKASDPDAPSISILSPQNQTYNTSDISLNFEVNMSIFYDLMAAQFVEFLSVSYELDGHRKEMNIEACENLTYTAKWTVYSRLKFSGNLTGLSDGVHSFRVSATGRSYAIPAMPEGYDCFPITYSDEVSNVSETIYFSVDTSSPPSPSPSPSPTTTPSNQQPEPFPTTLAVASIVAVAVVSVGLIVYFRKRKDGVKRE